MTNNFSPGQEIKFTKETLVFEQGLNESYQIPAGTKGVIVEDKDIGEAGECQIEIEKEGEKKVIVSTSDQNIKIA